MVEVDSRMIHPLLHIAADHNDLANIALQITNSDGANLFTVRDNGQIGINWDFGNSKPSSDFKLAINGGIISTFSRVQLSGDWQAYVFNEDYKLPSLEELENYISINHHLPNVPTASEVKVDGIDLGKMNQILLEKVEELALYVIDLQKQINELKK